MNLLLSRKGEETQITSGAREFKNTYRSMGCGGEREMVLDILGGMSTWLDQMVRVQSVRIEIVGECTIPRYLCGAVICSHCSLIACRK